MIYNAGENISELDSLGILIKEDSNSIELEYKSEYLTTKFLYYSVYKGTLICSFDLFEIQRKIKTLKGETSIERDVLDFFIEKGYTPFDVTYIKEIYKLPNLVKLIFNKRNQTIKYELIRKAVDPNVKPEEMISEAIRNSVEKDKKNYILFSGGFDSTLVADIAKYRLSKDQIELITGNLVTTDFIPNIEDVHYSKVLSSKLGLPLKVVDKELKSVTTEDLDHITLSRPTTAHFSIVYQAIKDYLNSESSQDYHVISGQQADSILNFGSTSFFKLRGRNRFFEGKGDLFVRSLYLSSPVYVKLLFSLINNGDSEGYILSPVVGKNKTPLIRNKTLYMDLLKLYKSFVSKFNKEDIQMIQSSFLLVYIFTFLSGSDASGVISTFNTDNSLPFSSKSLLWYYLTKENSLLDKIIPKRPIMNLLKQDKEVWETLKTRPNTPNISYLENFNKIGDILRLKGYQEDTQKIYGLHLPYCFNSIHLLKCLQKGDE